jgi:SAM-dependent methyltransferase
MSAQDPAGTDVSVWGVPLRYAVELEQLDPALRAAFVPSHLDTEGEAFLANALGRKPPAWKHRLQRAFTFVMSDFDANGLLGIYPVFLLSTPSALDLLERPWSRDAESSAPSQSSNEARAELARMRLLDIGAGSGDVTTRLLPLFASIDCTETSRFMARRLRRRGLSCWLGEIGRGREGDPLSSTPAYDAIALFNVIDRCRKPRALLAAARNHLPAGGLLLVSVPLPYEPFFYAAGSSREPEERLRVESATWEAAAGELWRQELAPLGLRLAAITRTPYLSGGDGQAPAYVLDSAVLVCRKV